MERILITGASGFIGRHTLRICSKFYPNTEIVGIYRFSKPKYEAENVRWIQADLCEPTDLGKLPKTYDIVIHLAGDRRGFVSLKEYHFQLEANVVMTSRLADHAGQAGCKSFIYASSVYAYSGVEKSPFVEDEIAIPVEMLGASKIASESLLKARAKNGQFKCLVLRVFTVYGPGSVPTQFVPIAINKIKQAGKRVKFGSSLVKRDFIYVKDVAEAFAKSVRVAIVQYDSYDVINLGTGIGTPVRKLVSEITDILGSKKDILFNDDLPMQSGDGDHCADIEKMKKKLNWEPRTNLNDGLKLTINGVIKK